MASATVAPDMTDIRLCRTRQGLTSFVSSERERSALAEEVPARDGPALDRLVGQPNPPRLTRAGEDAELVVEAVEVLLDGRLAHEQRVGHGADR